MSKDEVKQKLKKTKGYYNAETGRLKKGKSWLASHFNVSESIITDAILEFRNQAIPPILIEPVVRSGYCQSFFKKPYDLTTTTYSATYDEPTPYKVKYNVIKDVITGIIPDIHEPFTKKGARDFVYDTFKKHKVNKVVFIGDIMDNHAISYHEKDPSGKSILDEHSEAKANLNTWFKMFPVADVCIGNHDALPFRKLFTAGLPSAWLKSYNEILGSPTTWNWAFTHLINDVIYNHGTGKSGSMAAINFAKDNRCSTVIGHLHTEMSTKWAASFRDLIFGVSVGCLIDRERYAFAYGRENAKKEILGCTIIAENGKLPINIPMIL